MSVKTNYLSQVLGENMEALMAIREIPHFNKCSENLLKLVYQYGRIFSLDYNQELTRENEFDQWVFFILSGRLNVNVGNELVDTISSSLVGERCLLGEPRKATLSAAEEGFTALGVDMALMDTLRNGEPGNRENTSVYIELLSIITGEIVNRIADLAYNQIDIFSKYNTLSESENISSVLVQLAENDFEGNPRINIEIYKFLNKTDKELLAACSRKVGQVNTKVLFSICINSGRYALISDLALSLNKFIKKELKIPEQEQQEHSANQYNFKDFSQGVLTVIKEILKQNQSIPQKRPITDTLWQENFRLNEDLAIDIMRLCGWLKTTHGLAELDIIEVLMAILKEASEYTGKINGSLKNQVRDLTKITFITKLEKIVTDPETYLLENFNAKTPEEMIPMFSKHILEVHLIHPFLEQLELSGPPADGKENGAEQDQTDQSLADSLFD